MKKEVVVVLAVVLFVLGVSVISNSITGSVVGDSEIMQEEHIGPSAEDIACLESCIAVGCGPGDEECMFANSAKCEQECGVEPEPELADEGEACMQECVVVGCEEHDLDCQSSNMGRCEQECNMIGEPEAQSEEEQCIRDCVAKVDPNIMCRNSKEGEQGNSACQRCAEECAYLYSGPCLNEEEVEEKEQECISKCEHCYGEPVMGPSGQTDSLTGETWDCIIDVECKDASGEFGDDAGSGEDSFEEGHESPGIVVSVGEAVGDVFEGIGNFFKGLFG